MLRAGDDAPSHTVVSPQPQLQGVEYVANLLDVAISPDAFEPTWAYTYQQLLSWALVPADDDTLK